MADWHQKSLPTSVLIVCKKPNAGFLLVKDKQLTKDTYIYVIRDYTCLYPVQTIDKVTQIIELTTSKSKKPATV